MKKITLLAACLALAATGCTLTRYSTPTGERFSRLAIGNKTSVNGLAVEADANGVRKLTIKSYANDQAEAAAAVTAAAVSAAVKSAAQ